MDMGIISAVLGIASLAGEAAQSISANNKAKKQAETQADYLASQQKTETAARQNLLKAQLAKQRAAFASSGLDPDDGSASSVLSNIEAEADEDLSAIKNRYAYRYGNIVNSASAVQSRNLLTAGGSLVKKTGSLISQF